MDLEQEILHDHILSTKYEFVQKLGEGCFGKIYKVKNRQLKIFTALKLQIFEPNSSSRSMLKNEADILKSLKGKPFVPEFYSYGTWNLGAYIEIQLLVSDLSSLLQKVFSFDQICTMSAKLLQSLSILHNTNILHQDIKPQNIMINKKGEYVFIDFGISKKIKQILSGLETQGRKTKGFIGTPRQGKSKKDDLQSLMYNIAFLYFKKLPWLSLKVSGNRKIEQIKNTKLKTAEAVFQQMGKPFSLAFNYIKKLQFNEQPNYKYAISIFKRTHTMIADPNQKLDSGTRLNSVEKAELRKEKSKKLTLNPNENYGKYLELPFLTKEGISERKSSKTKGEQNKQNQNLLLAQGNNSMNGSRAISMNAYYELDGLTDEQDTPESKDMNLKEEQNQQPCVGNISKFFGALTMKNPFRVHN